MVEVVTMNVRAYRRVQLQGALMVPLQPEDAFELFTPDGERRWAHGWDPRFLVNEADVAEPGTVFVTEHEGRNSIWTVVSVKRGASIFYSVVTLGERCGLVTVCCSDAPKGCRVEVRYDMTSLTPDANDRLDHVATGFDSLLADWERAIVDALGNSPHRPKTPPRDPVERSAKTRAARVTRGR
jgi:hypothetical protein